MVKFKGNILLVEDDPMTQVVMERFLSKRGYVVDIVERGEDALKVLDYNRSNYRVAIVDIQLPARDGLQIIQSMSRCYKQLPIIAHTGFDDYYTRETALQVGAQAFFVKPASLVSLACWIKHHTRHVKDRITHEQWQATYSHLNAKSH